MELVFKSYIGDAQVGFIPVGYKYSVWVDSHRTGIIFSEPDGILDTTEEITYILLHEIADYLKVTPVSILGEFIVAWQSRKNNIQTTSKEIQ